MTLAWRSYAADVPRFVGLDRALLTGAGGASGNTNPRGDGAALGVIGSGGAVPSGFSVPGGNLNITQVTAQGVANGVPWFEYLCEPAVTTALRLQMGSVDVVNAQLHTGQMWLALVSPPPELTGVRMRIPASAASLVTLAPPTNGFPTRQVAQWTANATTSTAFQLDFAMSAAVPFRFRLGWPDFKNGPLTNPILPPAGSPAAASIGADQLTRALAPLGIGPSGASTWVFDVEFLNPQGSREAALCLDAGSLDRFTVERAVGGSLTLLYSIGGSPTQSVLGNLPTNERIGVALTLRGDGSARLSRGGPGATSGGVSGGPTTLTTVRGNGISSGIHLAHVRRRRMEVLPYAVSDAFLNTLAAQAATWT